MSDRKKFVISEIRSYNKSLPADIQYIKYCKMSATAYAAYRGLDHLYWADFTKAFGTDKFSGPKTKTWLQADLHAYNFGLFNDYSGDLLFGLNDFDESFIGDYRFDVYRMATSLILILRENGKSKRKLERKLVKTFAKSYLKGVYGQRKPSKSPTVFTSKNVKSPLKDFMKMVDKDNTEARKAMLDKWTKDRRFNTSLDKLASVTPLERTSIIQAIANKYRQTLQGPLTKKGNHYFEVLDVAERLLAGTGSLGTKRFYVLLAGDGPGKEVILDVKRQGSPSAFPYVGKDKFYDFENDAARTIEGYRALAPDTDPHIGWIVLNDGPYSVRERCPEKNAFPALVAELKKSTKKFSLKKTTNFLSMCEQWGQILAVSHAESANREKRIDYCFAQELYKLTKGKEDAFVRSIVRTASAYADQAIADYQYFTKWFDCSNCPKF